MDTYVQAATKCHSLLDIRTWQFDQPKTKIQGLTIAMTVECWQDPSMMIVDKFIMYHGSNILVLSNSGLLK